MDTVNRTDSENGLHVSEELTPNRAALVVSRGDLYLEVDETGFALRRPECQNEFTSSEVVRRFTSELLRSASQIFRSGEEYRLTLPNDVARRLLDASIVYEFLSGNVLLSDDRLARVRRNRIQIDSTPGRSISHHALRGILWGCRGEWRTPEGDVFRISWFVTDHGSGRSDSSDESHETNPSKSVARSVHRLRQGLESLGLPEVKIGVTRISPSTVDGAQQLVRIVSDEWIAFWPPTSFARIVGAIASYPDNAPSMTDHIPRAAYRITIAAVYRNGLASLAMRNPRTSVERRGSYAIKTVSALIATGRLRRFIDSVYRSGRRFERFVIVYLFSGPTWRRAFDDALGTRRREAIPQSIDLGREGTIWERYVQGLDELVHTFSQEIHRPGGAIDAQTMGVVEKYYLRPRTEAVRAVWERVCNDTSTDDLLEEGRLSLLRRIGRSYPRRTLVEAAVGRREGTKRRIASIFSRNGRMIYLEDVDVLERVIARGESVSWDQLLASQRVLRSIAEQIQH